MSWNFSGSKKASGRRLVLSTASHRLIAQAVADHLGIFDDVIATEGSRNLSGPAKLATIREREGSAGFDYMGDSGADLCLWKEAGAAYLVAPSARVLGLARMACTPAQVFAPRGRFNAAIRALRPIQWVKNILIFVPLLLAQEMTQWPKALAAALAFGCFSLVASAVYLSNDLLDLESDRFHPRKCKRPLASGALSIPTAIAIMLALLGGSFGASILLLPRLFTALLAFYFALSTSYSIYFKRRLLQDVMILAGLYTLRLLAGGAATRIHVTEWLLAFSMFMFLSLAFAKRYSELTLMRERNETQLRGRDYRAEDLEVILSVGPASGYLAVLVLCLYVQDQTSRINGRIWGHPVCLWMICPILLYWITRIWFFARRHALVDDPIVFALRDRASYIAGLVTLILALLASRP